MRYTKFLSELIHANGQPNFSDHQFRKVMNIVHLEAKILGLRKAAKLVTNQEESHKYDMKVFLIGKQLTQITGNLDPQDFFEEMIKGLR